MNAAMFQKPHELTVDTVDDPDLERATDAPIRITSSAIRGADLHFYEGGM